MYTSGNISLPGDGMRLSFASIACAFACSIAATAGAGPLFHPAQTYPIVFPPFGPRGGDGLTSGDFNADGRRDLAATVYVDDAVVTLTGKGNGTFNSPMLRATLPYPGTIVSARLNGDALDDLVVISLSRVQTLTANPNGSGTFTSSATGAGSGFGTNIGGSVALGDLNRDGKVDLATSGIIHDVSVMLGTGSSTFNAPTTYTVNNHGSVTIADFDRDSNPDVLVSQPPGGQLFRGDGTGALASPTPVAGSGTFFAAVDINSDNKLDLLGKSSNTLCWRPGNGNGTFGAETLMALGVSIGGGAVCTADFDQDGLLDLGVLGVRTDSVAIFRGNGNGTFAPAELFNLGITAGSGDIARYLVVDDFNADGFPDVATLSTNGIVSVLPNAIPEPTALPALALLTMLLRRRRQDCPLRSLRSWPIMAVGRC
jgi:hypothetical protein